MRRGRLLAQVLAVALAGCSLPFVGHPDEPRGGDAIGWENGYWYDDPVAVTAAWLVGVADKGERTARERDRQNQREQTPPTHRTARIARLPSGRSRR